MKVIPNVVGGWAWYVEEVKRLMKRQLNKQDYSDMMQSYIKGTKFYDAAAALPLEARPEPVEKKRR